MVDLRVADISFVGHAVISKMSPAPQNYYTPPLPWHTCNVRC
jgi:hypothetical protein